MDGRPPAACTALALACAAAFLGGCTIAEMRRDNERSSQQVQAKEQQLASAQEAQASLQAEHQRLLADLRSRELGVAELSSRLQALQRLNAATVASTQQQRQRKAALEKELGAAAGQVRVIEQAPDLGEEAKRKRLEDVRRQLRKTLELMAAT